MTEQEPEKKLEMVLKPELKTERKMERKTTIKFEWSDDDEKEVDKFYVIEKKNDGTIYFDGKLIVVKPLDQLNKEERKMYNITKEKGLDDEHSIFKANLTFFFHEKGEVDDLRFPHFCGNGAMYEITDAFILRTWSEKHLHDNYTVSKDLWQARSPSGEFVKLPRTCSDFVDTDFNQLLDLLE